MTYRGRESFDKIAIMGYVEHRSLAPFEKPEWLIVGLNDLYFELPNIPDERLSWFQIHEWKRPLVEQHDPSLMDFTEGPPHPRDPNHVLWLQEASRRCPVYIYKPHPELPDAVPLPLEEMFAYFDDGDGTPLKYFTNSISWMLGLAIMQLAPVSNGKRARSPDATIGVFGVDMMVAGGQGSEYGWQRPSCEWLLGWARGAGIKIVVPDESDLLKSAFQYGDDQYEYFRKKMQDYRNKMSGQRGQVTNTLNQAQLAHAELSGAINAADYFLRAHMPGDPGEISLGRTPAPDMHKEMAPGLTGTIPMDNGEG